MKIVIDPISNDRAVEDSMRSMRWVLVTIGIGISLLYPACATKRDTSIKIGVITTTTGASARYGIAALNGITLATDELNSKGGIDGKKINLVVEDDQSDSRRAVSAFTKLATIDKVQVIIGPISSSSAMACSPIANREEVILFSPAAATPAFTSPNDFTFRNRVSSDFEVTQLAEYASAEFKLRTVSVLYVNNDYGVGNKNTFYKIFTSKGGIVSTMEAFPEGSTDFRTAIQKIKDLKSDGLFLVGQGTEAGYALKQAHELGLKTQILSTITIERDDVLKIAGAASEGVVYAVPAYDTASSAVVEFDKKYRGRFHQGSDLFSANAYDAVYIITTAIRQVGYNANSIEQALFAVKHYHGVSGDTTFDRNGDVAKPIAIKRIIGGKFVEWKAVNNVGSH